ncbi:MAG: hypothetical protein MI745_12035 [Pseudomonadales bacterium]|nr:hypothetical protein [Pseudomonadales bacterium]
MLRWLILPFLMLIGMQQVMAADDSATLKALRKDLSSGSLEPVILRQSLAPLPDPVLQQWLADVPVSRFAITGFNENDQRFAARVRLHFADGGFTYVRIEGKPGPDYALTEWHDYASGLRLSELVALAPWFREKEGRAFLALLSRAPDSDELGKYVAQHPAAAALWLAQCSGQSCEQQATSHQPESSGPTLWAWRQVFAQGERQTAKALQQALENALGDDPYFWLMTGHYALDSQHCDWVATELQSAALRHHLAILSDVALQCYLAGSGATQGGTEFLDALSEQLGRSLVEAAIQRHYHLQALPVPDKLQSW